MNASHFDIGAASAAKQKQLSWCWLATAPAVLFRRAEQACCCQKAALGRTRLPSLYTAALPSVRTAAVKTSISAVPGRASITSLLEVLCTATAAVLQICALLQGLQLPLSTTQQRAGLKAQQGQVSATWPPPRYLLLNFGSAAAVIIALMLGLLSRWTDRAE